MARTGVAIPDSLDDILEALSLVGLSFSVVEPDGTAHGWMTTVRNVNADGSVSLWPGLRREGGIFRFDAPEGQLFEVYGGEHRMLRLDTEAKAFLLGNLLGFTGLDVHQAREEARALAEGDPYRRGAELHKAGWCPIWNGWQHYFTERR